MAVTSGAERGNSDQRNQSGSLESSGPEFICIGKIHRAHGIQGDVILDPMTDFPERIRRGKAVYAGEVHRPLTIASVRTKPPFLLQKPVRTGWDMRIYVLGGEIYSAILRTSDTDFRSNFSLGGKVQAVQPDAEAAALVRRITAILPLDFAGVDLLRAPDGSYVLGEIEDAVGCRMLYQETALDPARDLIRYVCRKKG